MIGGYTGTGQNNGYTPGLGSPYAGKPKQPGYGQAAYLGAGYGYGNVAGVQPDYASLQGQRVPSGSAKQTPYNGDMMVSGGIDGMSQFQPQSAGLVSNGKLGTMYGGMGSLPFEGKNPKFGIGGLQFGGSPSSLGTNGARTYGHGGTPYGPAVGAKPFGKYGSGGSSNGGQPLGLGSNANTPGKYGYGRMPYEIQTAGQSPQVPAYQPEPAGVGQKGKATGKYGGSQVPYASQALGVGGEAKPAMTYEAAALPYDSLPLELATGGKSYVKGETPTPAVAAVEGASIDRYDNVGYISGQVQPEVVAFPGAPTREPTVPYPSAASYLPVDSAVTSYGAGVGSNDPAPVTESQAASQGLEQTDDEQQMPRQIHIQQHLKLHFHPQGGNNGKFDLNGFFGNENDGYKG